MMINGTGATSINDVNTMSNLTPEDMTCYLATRLGNIDDQIQTQFQRQNQYKAASNSLNQLQSKLSAAAATANGVSDAAGGDEAGYYTQLETSMNDALAALPPDSQEYQTLKSAQAQYQGFKANGDMNKGQCQALSDTIKNIQTSIGSSAELDMINLNSLMSQRQTAVQMCSGMVASFGDTDKQLSAKIGA